MITRIKRLELTWEKLSIITLDRAPNMIVRNIGVVEMIAELTTSKMIETPIFYTGIFASHH